MVHAGCVFVAFTPFKSVRWNVYVHRLDLGLYSHVLGEWNQKPTLENGVRNHVGEWSQKPCWGMESETMLGNGVRNHVNFKDENLYWRRRRGSSPRRCIMQDSEPNTLPTELFRPPATLLDQHTPLLRFQFSLLAPSRF